MCGSSASTDEPIDAVLRCGASWRHEPAINTDVAMAAPTNIPMMTSFTSFIGRAPVAILPVDRRLVGMNQKSSGESLKGSPATENVDSQRRGPNPFSDTAQTDKP